MDDAVRYCVDCSAGRGGQVDSVVEVPHVFVDAGTIGGVHLVRGGSVTQGPDEGRVGHCRILRGRVAMRARSVSPCRWSAKLERAVFDEEDSGACDVVCRRSSRIRDHDGTFAATKIAVINVPSETEAHVAAGGGSLKLDDDVEPLDRTAGGSAAIDLKSVSLDGDFELAGLGVGERETCLDELDVGVRVVDPDGCGRAGAACLYQPQERLFVVTGRHRDIGHRVPLYFGRCRIGPSRRSKCMMSFAVRYMPPQRRPASARATMSSRGRSM